MVLGLTGFDAVAHEVPAAPQQPPPRLPPLLQLQVQQRPQLRRLLPLAHLRTGTPAVCPQPARLPRGVPAGSPTCCVTSVALRTASSSSTSRAARRNSSPAAASTPGRANQSLSVVAPVPVPSAMVGTPGGGSHPPASISPPPGVSPSLSPRAGTDFALGHVTEGQGIKYEEQQLTALWGVGGSPVLCPPPWGGLGATGVAEGTTSPGSCRERGSVSRAVSPRGGRPVPPRPVALGWGGAHTVTPRARASRPAGDTGPGQGHDCPQRGGGGKSRLALPAMGRRRSCPGGH